MNNIKLYKCNVCDTIYEKKYVYDRHKNSSKKHKLNLLENQNKTLKKLLQTNTKKKLSTPNIINNIVNNINNVQNNNNGV